MSLLHLYSMYEDVKEEILTSTTPFLKRQVETSIEESLIPTDGNKMLWRKKLSQKGNTTPFKSLF